MTDAPASAAPEPRGPDPAAGVGSGPPGGHLDLDALADALVGELGDDTHLRACSACRARLDELDAADDDLHTSLGALTPPLLPDAVAARWQEALRSAAPVPTARVVALRRPHRSWPASVAASMVLVLAGAVGWTALRDTGPTSADSASTAASGGSTSDTAESGTGGNGTADLADDDTAAGAAVPEQDEDTAAGAAREQESASRSVAAVPQDATGLDYADPAQRATAASRVLDDGAPDPLPAAAPPAGSSSPAEGLDRLRDPDALAACLSALDGPALAVDFARFGARPALAVLLPRAGDPDTVTVILVGAGCSAGDPEVLQTTSAPRAG